jgi:hypothetical protein
MDIQSSLTGIHADFSDFTKNIATRFFLDYSRKADSMATAFVKIFVDGEHRTKNLLSAEVKTVLSSANGYVVRVLEV